MQLAPAVQSLKPSATIAAAAKAKALKTQGVTVYDFTLGEPDFNTPEHIQEAARVAMKAGHTHYTASGGIPELKKAICAAFEREQGLHYEPNQVLVSNGAKHSIHNVLTALCGPGDEVIIPSPYWVSYEALVELTGATPVIVATTEASGFRLTAAQFEAAITPRTKLLLLNSPCNPTGAVFSTQQLEGLAQVAGKHQILVCSDEIYDKLLYTSEPFCSFATLQGGIADRTIIINGVSKAYAMTGWRIGWTLAPVELTAAMDSLQSQETSNPCSVSQYAALAALTGPQDCVETMRQEFARRREFALERLRALPDITIPEPGGAFYAFFNVSRYFGRPLGKGTVVRNSTDFCTALLDESHVALVSGDAFGAPGYVRLSFATSRQVLEAGFDRLGQFLCGQ
ncbi:MAG TPA: pyridoxal phosphate-dependent aminotransferase [Planctomycetaceae bacterium]|nr:pyridoxal phosphate-dependent aminotransferase [Planctomycetaceae bacterium]